MGVSRNRKGHKQKSRQRTLIEKNKKAKAQKELLEIFKNAQEEALQKKSEEQEKQENVVGVDELGDIGEGLQIEE